MASFFGVGKITKAGKDSITYRVRSVKDIVQVIIPHFDQYRLITQKYAYYVRFKQAVELMKDKKHLTSEGLLNIISIKASLNLGLSSALKTALPNISPMPKPLIQLPS